LQAETERLDAPSELKKQRRLIARVRTIQNERARAAAAKARAQESVQAS
jgi:large subunit ribosomal protein L29